MKTGLKILYFPLALAALVIIPFIIVSQNHDRPGMDKALLSGTGISVIYVRGDDGFYKSGRPLSFRDNGDGTVTDLNTRLTWVKSGLANSETNPPTPFTADGPWRKYTWENAILYCERLEFAGHSDWRLPNYKELVSILDLSKVNPAVDTRYFPDTRSDFYWTSTTSTYDPGRAWYVYFNLGYVNHLFKSWECYVRPVRGPN